MAARLTSDQIRMLGLLLGAGAFFYAGPAQAGFELVAPPPAPAAMPESASPSPVSSDALVAEPMPIVPPAPVVSEPIGPEPAHAAPVLQTSGEEQPVYIRRQRTSTLMKAPAQEPVDTGALLKATARNADIGMVPQNNGRAVAPEGRLLINPYPLQDVAATGVHDGSRQRPFVEQAMMEEGGVLRPVAVPGQASAVGMTERANLSGRYAGQAGYLTLPDSYRAPRPELPPVSSEITMTPIPGGEDAPLPGVVTPPEQAMPGPPPSATIGAGVSGEYTDAVGFGRDLPLPLALSQVIPPGYSYAFGRNVDLASNVSWQGGKPWNEVLNEMLNPSGMTAVIRNNQVTIQKIGS